MAKPKAQVRSVPRDDVLDQLVTARNVGTSLIGIETPDQQATVTRLASGLNGKAPIVQWDCVRGITGVGQKGRAMWAGIQSGLPPAMPGLPAPGTLIGDALTLAAKFDEDSIIFICNAHRVLRDNDAVVQALSNLRDVFKEDGRSVILLGPVLTMPPELAFDVMVIEEPLPTEPEIERIVNESIEAARENTPNLPSPDAKTMRQAVEALSGLTAYAAEQATAQSMTATEGLRVPELWVRKRRMVNSTGGLKMEAPSFTFADIGGQNQIKIFGADLFNGDPAPRLIVRIDEIDKKLSATGATGGGADSSGTQTDQLGVTLTEMEDNGWTGILGVGPAGSGKTLFSTALGSTYGVPTCVMDFGAMRDRWVGSSEQRIREAMRVLKAIGKGDIFFVATCNRLENLPPELKRRFRCGVWFFDLPTREERESIWQLQMDRYRLTPEQRASRERLNDRQWTGAEIRNCCEMAARFKIDLVASARYIVPVAIQDPDGVERLRGLALNRFLSVSYEGTYRGPAEDEDEGKAADAKARPARRMAPLRES